VSSSFSDECSETALVPLGCPSSGEGAHDDLVLSLAIALFAAEHPAPTFAPIGT